MASPARSTSMSASERLQAPPPIASTAHITIRNSTESDLLRLPAELRNRIAEFVLQPGTLHVYDTDSRHVCCHNERRGKKRDSYAVSVCEQGDSEAEYIAGRTTKSAPDYNGHFRAHGHCYDVPRSPTRTHRFSTSLFKTRHVPESPARKHQYSPSLLETCRQFHSETKLMPFTGNTFMFGLGRPSDFEGFIRKLTGAQRRAVTSVSIGAYGILEYPTEEFDVFAQLSSVKSLTIHVMEGSIWQYSYLSDSTTMLGAFGNLARMPLESASVTFWLHDFPEDESRPVALEVEAYLVRPCAGVDAEKKEEKQKKKKQKAKRTIAPLKGLKLCYKWLRHLVGHK